MQIFISQNQGPDLGTLQGDLLKCLHDSILFYLRTHGDLIDTAVFDRQKFQKIRKGGRFIGFYHFQALLGLFPYVRVPVIFLDIEVCLQDIDERMIGHTPAVREAPSLQKGHILAGHGLSELIQEPGFSHPGLGHDGKGLPPACLGPLQTIKQKLKLPLSARKRGQSPLGTDVKPRPSGTGSDGTVDVDRRLLAFNHPLTQTLEAK